jgi:DNA-binding SARP family transcriptional activator
VPGSSTEEAGWELVLLLAIHPIAGVKAETLAEALWPEGKQPKDWVPTLRQRRYRMRDYLRGLVPLDGDPLPSGSKGQIYRFNPRLIQSDVQRFLAMLDAAPKQATREEQIAAYEAALALYRGDLLDRAGAPNHYWLYDGPEVAYTLRAEYRRRRDAARRKLAELLLAGRPEDWARAGEVYEQMVQDEPGDEQGWQALFELHARRGDRLGLEAAARRLRAALAEVDGAGSPTEVGLPASLARALEHARAGLSGAAG